jgi:hypothetical protein
MGTLLARGARLSALTGVSVGGAELASRLVVLVGERSRPAGFAEVGISAELVTSLARLGRVRWGTAARG